MALALNVRIFAICFYVLVVLLLGGVNAGPALADWELPQDLNTPQQDLNASTVETPVQQFSAKTKIAPGTSFLSPPAALLEMQKREFFEDTDVALLVDASPSMLEDDCYGLKTRWEVCKEAALTLAEEAQRYSKGKITLVLFGEQYSVHPNVGVQEIKTLFAKGGTMVGTNIAAALKSQLEGFLYGRPPSRRLVVAVLTDGSPPVEALRERLEQPVYSAIVQATQHMDNARALRIAFFRIGQDASGSDFLRYLPVRVRSEGAKYDIVRSDVLSSSDAGAGLMKALLDSVADH